MAFCADPRCAGASFNAVFCAECSHHPVWVYLLQKASPSRVPLPHYGVGAVHCECGQSYLDVLSGIAIASLAICKLFNLCIFISPVYALVKIHGSKPYKHSIAVSWFATLLRLVGASIVTRLHPLKKGSGNVDKILMMTEVFS